MNNFLQVPMNLPNQTFQKIIASVPAQYNVSSRWSWANKDTSRSILRSPTRMNVDVNGTGFYKDTYVDLDLSLVSFWDSGLSTDYTTALNRYGLYFFIWAYEVSEGVLGFKISDDSTTFNTSAQGRVIEQFFCFGNPTINAKGQVVTGVDPGDIDISSCKPMSSGQIIKYRSYFPDPRGEEFVFRTDLGKLYYSDGSQYLPMGTSSSPIESVLKDTDDFRTPITDDQELFIDGTPSVVTSKGREPISGMKGGTWIPSLINVDGNEVPNPSCINIKDVCYSGTPKVDETKDVSVLKGSYGFFEDWVNGICDYLDQTNWYSGSTLAMSREGDWMKLTSSGSAHYAYISDNRGLMTSHRGSALIKKGSGNAIWIGNSTSSSANCRFRWTENEFIDGTWSTVHSFVRISDDLVWLVWDSPSADCLSIILDSANDYVYVRDLVSLNTQDFLPPFGQDGHSANDARAYNFNGWDKPISFTFKPQFDYSTVSNPRIVSNYIKAFVDIQMYYSGTLKLFVFYTTQGTIHVGWNGAVYDNISIFTSNSDLQKEITVTIYAEASQVRLWFDGQLMGTISGSFAVEDWARTISIGGIPIYGTPDVYYGNSLISNLCIHPTTEALPIDQSKPFYDQNKLYGKNSKFFLDQFGNFPGSSLLTSAGGIVEEGENIDGKYIIFESGLKWQFAIEVANITSTGSINNFWGTTSGTTYYGSVDIEFPIPFDKVPAVKSLPPLGFASVALNEFNMSTTGVTLRVWDTGALSTSRKLGFIAIGY